MHLHFLPFPAEIFTFTKFNKRTACLLVNPTTITQALVYGALTEHTAESHGVFGFRELDEFELLEDPDVE
jgi:hypothetical protein